MTEKPSDQSEIESLTRSQVLIAIGATALFLLIASTLWRRLGSITLLPWDFSWAALLSGLGLGLGVTIASSLVYRIWPAYRESADFYLALILKPLLLPDLIWLALLPGLSEELLFRGVMLPALGLNLVGLLLSSFCFGILHLSNFKQWAYVVWATLIGIVLGASAIVTHNLLVPILAHIVTNLVSSLIWKLGDPPNSGAGPVEPNGS